MHGYIIIPDNNKRKLLELNFEMYTGIKLSPLGNADLCIEALKNEPHEQTASLIICQANIEDENTILKVFYYVKSNHLNTPIICFGDSPKLKGEKKVFILNDGNNLDLKPLIQWVAKYHGITAEAMATKEVEDYYPVKISNLLTMKNTPVPVFDKAGESFKVFLNANSSSDQSKLQELFFKGKEWLYVDKKDRLVFVNSVSQQSLEYLKQNENEPSNNILPTIQAASNLYENSKQILLQTGMTDKALKYVIGTKDAIKSIITASDKLLSLISLLEKNNEGYLFKHAVLTSMLAHHLTSFMEWSSKNHLEAICFGAYFHDITLPDERLAKIHNSHELKAAKLNEKESKIINEHAFQAAQLISDVPNLPIGTVELVTEHHGQVNGIGFSEAPNKQVSELSAVFQVAEAYIHLFLGHKEAKDFSHTEAIEHLKKHYNVFPYKHVIHAFGQTDGI